MIKTNRYLNLYFAISIAMLAAIAICIILWILLGNGWDKLMQLLFDMTGRK